MRIALAQINPILGNLNYNTKLIIGYINDALKNKAELIIFPELCLTGYYTEDLTKNLGFLKEVGKALSIIIEFSKDKEIGIVFSLPMLEQSKIYNQGILIHQGAIQGSFRKYELPNYGVFDEKRVFTAASSEIKPIEFKGKKLGLLICEDMWFPNIARELKDKGAEAFIIINASPFEDEKFEKRIAAATKLVNWFKIPLLYVNTFGGHDEVVFDGGSFVLDKQALLIKEPVFWQEEVEYFNLIAKEVTATQQVTAKKFDRLSNIYQALMLGLSDYLSKNKFSKVVLGLSGGIDSALVAVLAADCVGPNNVRCIRLPSKYTSKASNEDAAELANNLGCQLDDIAIINTFNVCLKELEHLFVNYKKDITEENLQARIRNLLLMAVSNKYGELLLSTSNKSESATGYTTLYGDMSGGFAPIKDIYKTQIYELVTWRNKNIPFNSKAMKADLIPQSIITKPPTAELKENQLDRDNLPPYDLLDKILYKLIEEDKSPEQLNEEGFNFELACKVQKMIFASEYKRKQAPPGTKISKVNLSKDRRYPITNQFLYERVG